MNKLTNSSKPTKQQDIPTASSRGIFWHGGLLILKTAGECELSPHLLDFLQNGGCFAGNLSSKEIDLWIAGTSKENRMSVLSLDLSGSYSLTSLPESMGQLVKLTSLDLSSCTCLTSLPDSMGKLVNLTELNLRICNATIPASVSALPNLKIKK